MKYGNRDDIIQLTPEWKGDRSDDGRPRVSDDVLERMEKCSTEEAWAVIWSRDYRFQFQGGWRTTHGGKILAGRAVTAVFMPERPDLHTYLMDYGQKEEGRVGMMNSWVIETLVENDVLVVDLFGKVELGTFSGGNLSTAIAARTKRGQVIYGGIRDFQQIQGIDNLQTFFLDCDPTPIRDVTMVGMNVPCRIGNAVCMPGDVVLGTPSGVIFVPPQFAEEIVVHSERTRVREIFGLQRLREGTYTSAEMDTKWTEPIEADFAEWFKTNCPPEYAHLEWDDESETDKQQEDEETLL